MPHIKLSTGNVYYSERGQGAPIILLHANPGDSKDYDAVISTLSENYRVLALDWPGYGQSSALKKPELATVSLYYQILCDFLDSLDITSAFFIGNSIGGNVSTQLAIKSPNRVRGLILVSPGGFTPHNVITRSFCKLQGSRFSLTPKLWASLYLKTKTDVTSAMLERASTLQATPECISLNRAMWRDFIAPDNDLRQSAKNITAPTLLVFGEKDPAIPANKDGKAAKESIPLAEFVTFPCGHAAFAEMPEQFMDTVQPFLSALT